MWPINSYASDKSGTNATKSGLQSGKSLSLSGNTMIDGIDPNTIRLAANIRNIFGNSLSDNLLKSLGSHDESSDHRRHDPISTQQTRLTDTEIAAKAKSISEQQRRILDDLKSIDDHCEYRGPQRSTFRIAVNLKDNPSYDSAILSRDREKESSLQQQQQPLSRPSVSSYALPGFQTLESVEDEDSFLYGDSKQSHDNSRLLPPGIVNLAQRNASTTSRAMSPISERLHLDDDWGRRPSPPKEVADWPMNLSLAEDMREKDDMRSSLLSDRLSDKRRWLEEQLGYQKRVDDQRNSTTSRSPSFDRLLRSEMERSSKFAFDSRHSSRDSEPLSPTNLLRNLSPPQPPISYFNERERYRSPSLSPRRRSPPLSPNRVRKRSRSISPRRRTVSPKRKFRRTRSRTRSRSRSRSTRKRSRSRSRSRSSRQLSRTPERRSRWSATPALSNTTSGSMSGESLVSPMGTPIMQMTPHGMMPPYGHQMPMYPAMFYPRPYRPNFNQRPMQMMPLVTQRPNATLAAPADHTRKPIESKLINERDLLMAEREKLRANLNSFEKLLAKKTIEQNHILAKVGGKDSYINKQVSKAISGIKKSIEDTELKLEKNAKQIHDFDKTKNKSADKRKAITTTQKPVNVDTKDVGKPLKDIELKKSDANKTTEKAKEVSTKEDSDDDSDNSRFLYYDGGVHWCKLCNKFFNTIALYFTHLHTTDHLSKQKSSESTPWKEKNKSETKPKLVAKNQLRVPCKGHQFIYPTQGFYCNLCEVFSVDSSAAEEHFRSPKHNRSYTRYTLLHNNYEMKWKSERDAAYTAVLKREREEEMESLKKDNELRVEKRKKLEEELKRKEKEIKEKIELMNKNAKVVTELDGIGQQSNVSIEKSKDNTNTGIKTTSKEIKLNLSSHRHHKSSEKSRNDDRRGNKREKSDTKSRTKHRDKDVRSDANTDNERVITSFDDIYKEVECDSTETQMDFALIERELDRLKKEILKQEEFEVRQVVYNLIQAVVEKVDTDCGKANASGISVAQVSDHQKSFQTTNKPSTHEKHYEKSDKKLVVKKIKEERKSPTRSDIEDNNNKRIDCKLDDECSDELDGFEIIDSIVSNDDSLIGSAVIETITISDDEK